MKQVLLALLAYLFVLVFPAGVLAAPNGYINDEAGVLSVQQERSLTSLVEEIEKTTTNEIAVLTATELKNETIEMMAERVFREWGIGKAGKDNGILILLAVKDRQIRIEVGYGLEGVVTDLSASQIINNVMVPQLKKGDYYKALELAITNINSLMGGGAIETGPAVNPLFDLSGNLIGIVFAVGYMLFALLTYTRSWWLGGVIGAGIGLWIGNMTLTVIFGIIGLLIDLFLSKLGKNTSFIKMMNSGGGMGGSGFGGSRGSSFGGGRSGGGGASGRW